MTNLTTEKIDAAESELDDVLADDHDNWFIDRHTRDTIMSALDLARDMQWQPIETAPKDGTGILANWNFPDCNCASGIASVYWSKENSGWYDFPHGGEGLDAYGEPTHWMPLPKPPEARND